MIGEWNRRYREGDRVAGQSPVPLVVAWAKSANGGDALDLACGAGRNALWLAAQGWRVTAVDGAEEGLALLRASATERGLDGVATVLADLEVDFEIGVAAWDLVVISCYLQRDLFARVLEGLRPGGMAIVIALLDEEGAGKAHRVRPGELRTFFTGMDVVWDREGGGRAEIVAVRGARPTPSKVASGGEPPTP